MAPLPHPPGDLMALLGWPEEDVAGHLSFLEKDLGEEARDLMGLAPGCNGSLGGLSFVQRVAILNLMAWLPAAHQIEWVDHLLARGFSLTDVRPAYDDGRGITGPAVNRTLSMALMSHGGHYGLVAAGIILHVLDIEEKKGLSSSPALLKNAFFPWSDDERTQVVLRVMARLGTDPDLSGALCHAISEDAFGYARVLLPFEDREKLFSPRYAHGRSLLCHLGHQYQRCSPDLQAACEDLFGHLLDQGLPAHDVSPGHPLWWRVMAKKEHAHLSATVKKAPACLGRTRRL
jgi:hypothetical protein